MGNEKEKDPLFGFSPNRHPGMSILDDVKAYATEAAAKAVMENLPKIQAAAKEVVAQELRDLEGRMHKAISAALFGTAPAARQLKQEAQQHGRRGKRSAMTDEERKAKKKAYARAWYQRQKAKKAAKA